jgi:hypothetical protein
MSDSSDTKLILARLDVIEMMMGAFLAKVLSPADLAAQMLRMSREREIDARARTEGAQPRCIDEFYAAAARIYEHAMTYGRRDGAVSDVAPLGPAN